MQRGNDVPSQRTPVNMALKMLISPKEGACILGPNGSFSKQIIDMTGARLQLSQKGDFYPGTQMQELCVKGATNDSVVQAMMQVISRMSEDAGRICGGETDVEEGGARVHFVVPVESAKAVIGKGGESIKSIRAESGMRIHVEEIVVGAGEMAEQVVSCAGPVKSLVAIVGFLIEKVMEVSSLPWFRDWASDLKACPGGIPTTQVVKGGKGAPMIGMGKMSGKGSGYASAPVTPAAGIEQLKGALSAMPDQLADPMDQSQVVQCVCPAHLVASLGHRLQQIAGATGTYVDVRNVPGNPDRAITITGNAVACSAAYLHVVSQLSGGNMGGAEQPMRQMQPMQPAQHMQQMQPMQQMQMQPMQSVGLHGNAAGMGGMGCMGGMCGMGGGGSMGGMGNMGNMGAVGASNFL